MTTLGGHVLAGQELEGWAKEAGFDNVVYSKSPALNAGHTPRVTGEPAKQAIQYGLGTEEELNRWAEGWKQWDETEGSEFVFEAGEILVTKA